MGRPKMKEKINPPAFLESIADELLAKFRRLDRVLDHAPTKGTYHEKILRSTLRDFLPFSLCVGEGFVQNKKGRTSTQLDFLVVDNFDPRSFGYKQDDFFIAFEVSVTTIGEIKTCPNKGEFKRAFLKLCETATLFELPGRLTSFLFCYEVRHRRSTIKNWVEEVCQETAEKNIVKSYCFPDYIFFLKNNYIAERQLSGMGSVQYIYKGPKGDNFRAIKEEMISKLFECVMNGAGRLKMMQTGKPLL